MTQGLPERELQGLLEIISAVNTAPDLPSFRQALMTVLPRVIPASIVAYNEISFDGRPLVTLAVPAQPQELYEVFERVGYQNPLIQHHLTTRDGRARRISDVVEREEFEALDFYKEVFVPMGVEHQVAVTLPAPPELLIGVALSDSDDFTDAECRVLDLARPHIIQAHANAALREQLRDVLRALAAGLDDTAEAVVVAGSDGRLRFASAAGRAALALLDGGTEPEAGSPLPAVLRDADSSRVMVEIDDEEPIVIRRLQTDDHGTTIFVLEREQRVAARGLLEQLGLTPREAEVLQAMMRGQPTGVIALKMEISPRTVHKHAERIFLKLGVHDRLGAVNAAWAALDAARGAISRPPV